MATRKPKPRAVATNDSFSNPAARTGVDTPSLINGSEYVATRRSFRVQELQNMYRSDWVVRRVIDAPAEDMLKNWLSLTCQITPQEIDAFTRVVDDTCTQHSILVALKNGRLFGGAGAVMWIDGHADILDQPLVLEDVEIGAYKGLMVFDRWSGISPSSELINDPNYPWERGEPEFYDITTTDGEFLRVHHSRVLRFLGREVLGWERATTQHWGISEVELIYDSLRMLDNTSWNIAGLVQRSNVFITKYKGFRDLNSGLTVNETGVRQFQAQMAMTSELLNSNGMLVLDKDEDDFETHSASFGGLNEILTTNMLMVCGATEIPFSRLFGRTVTGLSQSNEGDEQIYYDSLDSKRRREVRPQLRKVLPVIAMSTWGYVPDDFDWKFNPIQTVNSHELAELAAKKAEAIGSAYDRGLPQRVYFQELRALSEETGMFSSITDEMVAAASDKVEDPNDPGPLPDLPSLNLKDE